MLLAVLFAGCIKEDRDNCLQDNNVEVHFFYTDADDGLGLTDYIQSIDLFVFDDNHKFVEQHHIRESALQTSNVKMLTLPEGTYYLVAWANVGSNSAYNTCTVGVTDFDDCVIQIDGNATETGDEIYYAPYKEKPSHTRGTLLHTRATDFALHQLVSSNTNTVVKEMDFVRAHRSIHVWVQGYEDNTVPGTTPTVRAKELLADYNFGFEPMGTCCVLEQCPSAVSRADSYLKASFHSGMGAIDSSMEIELLQGSDATTRATVNLLQFVTENAIESTDDIDVLISFASYGIEISVPAWDDTPVGPGL